MSARKAGPARVRIPRGRLRGRTIGVLDGTVRPTASRTLEALLSIIAPLAADHTFVDAYSGSGLVALSAWSMGFPRVLAFECDAAAMALLRGNVAACEAQLELHQGDVSILLQRIKVQRPVVVFADPPYANTQAYLDIQKRAFDAFSVTTQVILEFERGFKPELHPAGHWTFNRTYGRTTLAGVCFDSRHPGVE